MEIHLDEDTACQCSGSFVRRNLGKISWSYRNLISSLEFVNEGIVFFEFSFELQKMQEQSCGRIRRLANQDSVVRDSAAAPAVAAPVLDFLESPLVLVFPHRISF